MLLTAAQQITLANGMHTAATKYRECAAAMRAEALRIRSAYPDQDAPTAAERTTLGLAAQFDRQAADAAQLAAIIEQATDVQIID